MITVVPDISFTLFYMRKLAPFSYAQWDCSQLTTGSSYSVRLTSGLFPGVSQIPSAVSHWWLRTGMQLSEWPFRSPSLDLRLAGTIPCLVPLGCAMVVEYPWVSSKNPLLDFPCSLPVLYPRSEWRVQESCKQSLAPYLEGCLKAQFEIWRLLHLVSYTLLRWSWPNAADLWLPISYWSLVAHFLCKNGTLKCELEALWV